MPARLHPVVIACMSVVLALGMAGCTIGAESTPTLANTTSAEQVQRLFWQQAKDQKWATVQSLLTANVAWRNNKTLLTRDEVVPFLKQQQLKDFLITNLIVKSNEGDMTVLYDLQVTTAASPQPVNFHAVSVWQQVPPLPDKPTKDQKKQAHTTSQYLLTVEDLAPDTVGQ